MGRIVFLNPNPRHLISGGVKTVYRHVEMLTELGFEACVFQPDGRPEWLKTSASVLTNLQPPARDEILVFPENATGWIAELAQGASAARKVLFCQNQYYMFDSAIPPERYHAAGFSRIICPGEIAKGFLARVFHLDDVAVVPYHIDQEVFFPRAKSPRIALMPHKLPRQAVLMQETLHTKYPRLKAVPWEAIDNTTEEQTANLLGRSTVYLSLSSMESFGLVPLEAMASHCIVVGFHGYGGMEYASPKNGYWFSPDQLEEVVDALASVIDRLERGDEALDDMRTAGVETVGRYTRAETKAALARVYGPLVAKTS
jgi:hypothetical protein